MRTLSTFAAVLGFSLLQVDLTQAATNTNTSAPLPAQSVGLTGSTLSWQYYFAGGPYESRHNFVVGSGSGIGGEIGGIFHEGTSPVVFGILANDSSITFDYSIFTGSSYWNTSILSLPPTIYNGISINTITGPPFIAVTINPATNMVGFDSSRVSFKGAQIQVDWQGLSFNSGTIVKLDVNVGVAPTE